MSRQLSIVEESENER